MTWNSPTIVAATVVRTDGSTKTKDDSAKVTVTGPNITKTAGNYDNDTNSIEYTVYINEKGEALGNTGSITVVDKYDYSNAAAVKRVFIKDGSLKLCTQIQALKFRRTNTAIHMQMIRQLQGLALTLPPCRMRQSLS